MRLGEVGQQRLQVLGLLLRLVEELEQLLLLGLLLLGLPQLGAQVGEVGLEARAVAGGRAQARLQGRGRRDGRLCRGCRGRLGRPKLVGDGAQLLHHLGQAGGVVRGRRPRRRGNRGALSGQQGQGIGQLLVGVDLALDPGCHDLDVAVAAVDGKRRVTRRGDQ